MTDILQLHGEGQMLFLGRKDFRVERQNMTMTTSSQRPLTTKWRSIRTSNYVWGPLINVTRLPNTL